MRNFINIMIAENTGGSSLQKIQSDRDAWIEAGLRVMDERSVQAVLEDYESDENDLAEMWFDDRMAMFRFIEKKGEVPIYRHMMVEDFRMFVDGLEKGTAGLGNHWSLMPDIESPTWKQDQRGDVPVMISGKIAAHQIDWEQSLIQQFEWPHEAEVIFAGDVEVEMIEDQDTDETYHPKRKLMGKDAAQIVA